MTIQSLAWGMDQPVPGTAKLVLLALANHSDHLNGFVHFDAPAIAREASIEVSGLWRYLGALERNGYLSKDERKTSDGEKRDYWLVLDRDNPAPWAWAAHDGGSSGLNHGYHLERDPSVSCFVADEREAGGSVHAVRQKSFRRDLQEQARKSTANEDALLRAQGVAVIEGSKAFHAWCAHLRARRQITPFTQQIIVNGKEMRGFYRPTLFPPRDDDDEDISA